MLYGDGGKLSDYPTTIAMPYKGGKQTLDYSLTYIGIKTKAKDTYHYSSFSKYNERKILVLS